MLKLEHIHIQYGQNIVIQDGSFCAESGCLTAIRGESGSGKSSLLNIISLYKYEQNFDYWLNGMNLANLSKEELRQIMRTEIAYLEQNPVFFNSLTLLQNIMLEVEIAGQKRNVGEIYPIIEKYRLNGKENKYPSQLSGGEKQRLALAMAEAKDAKIILCDEITSALDADNTNHVLSYLQIMAHQENKIVIISSHEKNVLEKCDVCFEMNDKNVLQIKSCLNLKKNKEAALHLKRIQKKSLKCCYFHIVSARLKKRKAASLLLIVIGALISAGIVFFSEYMAQGKAFWNDQLSKAVVNEMNIGNDNPKGFLYDGLYDNSVLFFEEDIKDALLHYDQFDAIYPIEGGCYFETGSTVTLHQGERIIHSYTFAGDFVQGQRLSGEQVFPYFKEQRLNEISEQVTNQTDGIYLGSILANILGIDKLEDNMTLSFDFFAPVAVKETTGFVYTEGYTSGRQKCYEVVYEKIHVELPVSGILPLSYRDSGLIDSTLTIFMPHDDFYHYTLIAKEKHVYKQDELEKDIAYYKAFLNVHANREEVKNELMLLSEHIAVCDHFVELDGVMESLKDTHSFLAFSISGVLGLTVIMLLIYSVYHKRDIDADWHFFAVRGMTIKQKKLMGVLEIMIFWGLIALLSHIALNLLLINGVGNYALVSTPVYEINYLKLIFKEMLICAGISLMSEFALLKESSRIDR